MAIRFDGTSTNCFSRTSGLPSFNGAYTWMGWVRLVTDLNTAGNFWAITDATFASYDTVGVDVDGTTLYASTDVGAWGGVALTVGTPYHITFVRESSSLARLYVNGVDVGTNSGDVSGRPAAYQEYTGSVLYSGFPTDCQMWGVKMWETNLTQAEVLNEIFSLMPKRKSNLHGAWPMIGQNSTDASQDFSGNGRDQLVFGSLNTEDNPYPVVWGAAPLVVNGASAPVEVYSFQGNAFQFGQYVGGGAAGVEGELDQNIGAITASATGQVVIRGVGAGNVIGAVTSSATGKVEIRGVGANNTIGAVTLSATGDVDIAGSANITVGAITSSATGTVLIKGVGANNTIGDVTLAGTGVVGSSVSGELDQNIGNITLAATGQVLVQGVASNSIGNITLSATGQVEIHGIASVTVGAITSSATGKVNIAGTTNATIGNITVAAVGGVRNVGVLNTTIGDITSSATGTVLLEGELSKTIGDITVSATGVIGSLIVGQLNTSIGIFTLQATGGVSNTVRTIGASIQAGSLGGGLQKRAYSKSRYRQENMKWPSRG